ncbi:MAG: hypothetical protein KAH12_04135 [Anaerolineales bacterium]|nr:hypothetical protein [Anaerolineales bacterium]
MPKRRLTWIWIVVLAVVFLLGLAAVVVYFTQPAEPLPSPGPRVIITSPEPEGLTAPLEMIEVTAIASGDQPIHHLELWLDGQLTQTYFNPDPGQASPVQISFNQPLKQGSHFLFVRAVDTYNLIGQSLPVTAEGSLAFVGEGPFSLVQVQVGDTLDETLAANGTDLAAVLPFNPGLGSGASPGTTIAIPIPPEAGSPPAGNPAQPLGNPTLLDLIKLLPGANPPLQMFPTKVFGPPPAPTDLQVSTADCTLNFTWQDTSEVEAGFQIWVTGLGLSPRVAALTKAAPATGPVKIEIPALGKGDYVYWVEAYNSAGAQPSNQVFVSINDPCPNQLSGSLTMEVVDFKGPSQYDKIYCYVSILDNPEVRLPAGQDQFIPLSDGAGDLTSIPLAARSYTLPVSNQDLKVQGECWGWAGASLSKLGTFNQAIQPAQWDGSRIPLNGPIFEIGLQLNLTAGEMVLFAAPDPGIPAPRIISLEKLASLADVGLDLMDALNYLDQGNKRILVWEWLPSPSGKEKLTGFTILINGIPYQQINDPETRTAEIAVPGFCGTRVKVSMVANIADRQSLPSNQLVDQQNPCHLYALVNFREVFFAWVNDSPNPNNRCDDVQTFFDISVTEVWNRGQANEVKGTSMIKHFNGGGFYQQARCGFYDLDRLAGPAATAKERNPASIILPLRLIEGRNTEYDIEATIWHYDSCSDNDVIARFLGSFYFNPGMVDGVLAKMQGSPARLEKYFCDAYTATYNGDAKSKIDICVDLYTENPSNGTVTLPDNTPRSDPIEPIESGPNLPYTPVSDLALTGIYINPDGEPFARIQNNGPDDLKNIKIEITTTVQTDDPNLVVNPSYTALYLYLKKDSRRDINLGTQKLDPSQYSYTLTAEVTSEEYNDLNLSNNKLTTAFTASAFQTYPDLLEADLQIAAIKVDYSGKFKVDVLNGGPDLITTHLGLVTVICEATQVSRVDGTSTKIAGLETFTFLNLDAGQQAQFYPVKEGFEFNQLLNWYIISCQVKSGTEFTDPNPANNFLTETVQ